MEEKREKFVNHDLHVFIFCQVKKQKYFKLLPFFYKLQKISKDSFRVPGLDSYTITFTFSRVAAQKWQGTVKLKLQYFKPSSVLLP